MSDLNLEASNLLGELDSLGVRERLPLVLHISDVQHLAHEVNGWLGLVEGGGRHVHIEHHLPLRGSHGLMEAKPDLSTSTQGMIVAWNMETLSQQRHSCL